jgi:hypothetical protein
MRRIIKTFEGFNQDTGVKSLSFPTDSIDKHLELWRENDIEIENSFDKEGVTYVEFYTKDDMKKAAALSQDVI